MRSITTSRATFNRAELGKAEANSAKSSQSKNIKTDLPSWAFGNRYAISGSDSAGGKSLKKCPTSASNIETYEHFVRWPAGVSEVKARGADTDPAPHAA